MRSAAGSKAVTATTGPANGVSSLGRTLYGTARRTHATGLNCVSATSTLNRPSPLTATPFAIGRAAVPSVQTMSTRSSATPSLVPATASFPSALVVRSRSRNVGSAGVVTLERVTVAEALAGASAAARRASGNARFKQCFIGELFS